MLNFVPSNIGIYYVGMDSFYLFGYRVLST